MAIKVVSFDVHGTLTNYVHVEAFWWNELPRLYALKNKISLEKAKAEVKKEYSKISKYDMRWYLPQYWFNKFEIHDDCRVAIKRICKRAELYPECGTVLGKLSKKYRLIVSSASTHDFLDYDIAPIRKYFTNVFSAPSDFGIIGKPKKFFIDICRILGVRPDEVAHVGDDIDFDYKNPKSIGIHSYFLDKKNKKGGNKVGSLIDFENEIKRL